MQKNAWLFVKRFRVTQAFICQKGPSGGTAIWESLKMESHGIQLESCPRCGKQGLLIERDTVTTRGDKKYTYRKWYVAHYSGNYLSQNGKLVDRIHWCYMNSKQLKQLQSVTQNVRQTATQTVTQTEDGNSRFFSEKSGSPGEIRTPVGGSKAHHSRDRSSLLVRYTRRGFCFSTGLTPGYTDVPMFSSLI